MKRVRSWALAVVVGFVGLLPQTALLQSSVAKVSLTQSVGPPDGDVAVPLKVEIPDGVDVGMFTLTIRVSSKELTFLRAEIGGLGEAVGAEVKTSVKPDGDTSVVEVIVSTPEKNGARAPLPGGPLAQMMFKVAKELKPQAILTLKTQVTAVGTKANAPVKMETQDGSIIVSTPGVISCVFYMH